ncbi:NPHN protein, partial [Rhinopomastus cyanomelas]|nr:NPHN protein [Rhinopomastus cyanomelas]
ELEAGSVTQPVPVLVPDGSDWAELQCRAQGVPGVQLYWEHWGQPLHPDDTRFQEKQWREGPWTSSLLRVATIGQERSRLRHQFQHSDSDEFRSQWQFQYLNWAQSEHWEQNRTLGTFVCVAQSPLGTARRHLQLRLAGTGL